MRGRSEGSSYQRGERWVGAVSLGYGKRKVIYGRKCGAVAERMKVLLHTQKQGLPINLERQTVGVYLVRWLAGAESSIRPSTFRRYGYLVRGQLVPQLGKIDLAKLGPTDLGRAYATLLAGGLSARSVGHAHRVLGRALHDAEISGLVARNPTRIVRPPRVPRTEMRTLTGEQVRTLLASVDGRLAALLHVAVASGARSGELRGLQWSDVDFTAGTIRIVRTVVRTNAGLELAEPKTASSRRTITVGRPAIEAVRTHKRAQAAERPRIGESWNDLDLVFPSALGTILDDSNMLANFWYPALAKAGLPRLTFHSGTRHTCATLLLESGAHPRVVAERLGHATPSLVMNVYGHATERMQRDATAAMERVLGA